MTTPSSPSSRPQPISLDVDIELTELTPAEGLPTRSPANPASVDMQALLAREEAACAQCGTCCAATEARASERAFCR